MSGKVEQATMVYIIRDHSMERFQERKAAMAKAADEMNRRYGENSVVCDMEDQYYNMYEVLKDRMEIVRLAEEAMKGRGDSQSHPLSHPGRYRRLHADLQGPAVPQPAQRGAQCPRPV